MNNIEQRFYNAFVEELENPENEISALYEIKPQTVIGLYKVDFLVADEFVIEIDGYEYHKTKEQREQDYNRERYLMRNGYTVIRFTGTEVYLSPNKCARETAMLVDKILVDREIKEVSACFNYYEHRKQREEALRE